MDLSSLYFQICSMAFLIVLTLIYFLKKKQKSLEITLYSILIITNFIGLIFDFSSTYIALVNVQNPYLNILSKLYLVYLFSFYYIFIIYTFVIVKLSKNKTKTLTLGMVRKSLIILIWLILSITILILPLSNFSDGNIVYTFGLGVEFLALLEIIGCLIMMFLIIKNIKKVDKKKVIPIVTLIILGVIATAIQFYNPQFLILTSVSILVTFIMYFTIENPDVKMINELEFAKNQAEKANRAKTDFLSSMSHEIRTPLNAIVGLSEIIKTNNNIDEIHEDANDVVMASQNLLEIVNGILDISKIEADKMEIIETTYNPLEIFNDLTKLSKLRIGEKEIELRTNFAPDIPKTLLGDKGKLKQIITNLLTNAVKYTEKGYIDFDVKCINQSDLCKLQIVVSDTGRGIKESQMNVLFNKFQRLDEDKNTTIEGTGLGLAITKSLTEMMGGKIIVHSTYGEGSKFTVFLSQKISTENIIEANNMQENITYDGKKVLVVDDNALNIKVATKILNEFKLDITGVESGFECISKIKNKEHFDLILLDIMMPKMDGVETLKKLKEIENFNIPTIALTADAMEGKEAKYLEIGFNGYLSKPIEKQELKKILNKYLNNDGNEEKEVVKEVEEQKHTVKQITDDEIEMLNNKLNEELPKEYKNNVDYLKENDIDVMSSLELLGDIEMYNETLKTFITESETRIPRIEKNKNENNMKDYSIDVHAMKSDSKYLGFKKLAELSFDHEMKSKENDTNYINEHYDELMNEYTRIRDVIDKYM